MSESMNIISIKTAALDSICKYFGVRELYAFGSVINNQLKDDSDLDFLVVFDRKSPHGAFDQYMGLKMALESEFERPVDLVTQKLFRNPLFQSEIDSTKVLLYAA
jgi:predicted nucleotidyltransferase